MKKSKSFAGYINLKPINGVIYPSSIQNIIMKDHISSILKGKFYLSPMNKKKITRFALDLDINSIAEHL